MIELSSDNHGFIKKDNFYKFHNKNQNQPPEEFEKKCVLRNFAKFIGKDLFQSHFFHKVAGLRPIKKCLRTPVLKNTSGRLLLKIKYQTFKNLFQIFLIYEFPFRKAGESFIVSLFFVPVVK